MTESGKLVVVDYIRHVNPVSESLFTCDYLTENPKFPSKANFHSFVVDLKSMDLQLNGIQSKVFKTKEESNAFEKF